MATAGIPYVIGPPELARPTNPAVFKITSMSDLWDSVIAVQAAASFSA